MGHHIGEIERGNAGHHTQRLTLGTGFHALTHFQNFTLDKLGHGAGKLSQLDGFFDFGASFVISFAVFFAHEVRKGFHVAFQQGFVAVEYLYPLLNWRGGPGGESGFSGLHGRVEGGGSAEGHGGNQRAV